MAQTCRVSKRSYALAPKHGNPPISDWGLFTKYEKGDEMDHLMFEVKDARKTFKSLVDAGAEIAMKVFEIRDRRYMGFVKDRDGIWVGVISRK